MGGFDFCTGLASASEILSVEIGSGRTSFDSTLVSLLVSGMEEEHDDSSLSSEISFTFSAKLTGFWGDGVVPPLDLPAFADFVGDLVEEVGSEAVLSFLAPISLNFALREVDLEKEGAVALAVEEVEVAVPFLPSFL